MMVSFEKLTASGMRDEVVATLRHFREIERGQLNIFSGKKDRHVIHRRIALIDQLIGFFVHAHVEGKQHPDASDDSE